MKNTVRIFLWSAVNIVFGVGSYHCYLFVWFQYNFNFFITGKVPDQKHCGWQCGSYQESGWLCVTAGSKWCTQTCALGFLKAFILFQLVQLKLPFPGRECFSPIIDTVHFPLQHASFFWSEMQKFVLHLTVKQDIGLCGWALQTDVSSLAEICSLQKPLRYGPAVLSLRSVWLTAKPLQYFYHEEYILLYSNEISANLVWKGLHTVSLWVFWEWRPPKTLNTPKLENEDPLNFFLRVTSKLNVVYALTLLLDPILVFDPVFFKGGGGVRVDNS